MTTRTIWVDTDVALGSASGDVDDGFALAALLGASRRGLVSLLGISAVAGNASASEAERCARRIVEESGARIPVVAAGAAAAAALASLPDGVAILAIGPLTNVAEAVARDPDLPRRAALSVVGGNLSSAGFLPPLWPHEFNFARDRGAARAVLSAAWRDRVLYPLDVLRHFRCDARRLRAIGGFGRLGELLARDSRRWERRARWRHGGRGFPVWDLVPALCAAGAIEVQVEERAFPTGQRRAFGIPARVRAAVAFDAIRAWSAFDSLIRS